MRRKTAKVLRKHASKRALLRFGLSLTSDQIDRIDKSIREGNAKFYDRQSLTVTRWIVNIGDQEVAAVYDKKRKTIRTLMPVAYLETTPMERALNGLVDEE